MSQSRRGSYISTQLDSINAQLQTLFDDLGISIEERDDREKKVYSVIAEALQRHVEEVKLERDELKSRCLELQQNVRDMASALRDVDLEKALGSLSHLAYSDISPPYNSAKKNLDTVFSMLEVIYTERSDKAKALLVQLTALSDKLDGMIISSHLKPPSSKDDLNLSNSYLTQLETEIQRWRNELQSRISTVSMSAAQIVALWVELGTPQESIDSNIMSYYKTEPEKLGTSMADVARLTSMKESLVQEKTQREERLSKLMKDTQGLWEKLMEDENYTREFQRANRGLSLQVLEAYENENSRLQEKKRQHIHVFIQDSREQLQELWAQHYFSEEETYEFTPAWADIFTEASLEAHESEVERLQALLKERQPILSLIQQFNELQNEEKQLEASTQDASRLLQRGGGKRDPTRLLREEKIRKRLAKRKPIVLHNLKEGLEAWEEQTGKPFLINGESFYDILEAELAKVGAKKPVRKPLSGAPSSTLSSKPSIPNMATPRETNLSKTMQTPLRAPVSPTKPVPRSVLAKQAMPPPSIRSGRISPSKARPLERPESRGPRVYPSQSGNRKVISRSEERYQPSRSAYMETPVRSRPGLVTPPLGTAPRFETANTRCKSGLSNYPNSTPDNRPRSVMGTRTFNSGIARLTAKANGEIGLPSSRILSAPSFSPNSNAQNRSATSLGTYRPVSPPNHTMTSRSTSNTSSYRTISTNSTTGSENWKSLDETSSSEDEFDDPVYVKWREEAVKRLENTPKAQTVDMEPPVFHRKERVSEFNWDKDTF